MTKKLVFKQDQRCVASAAACGTLRWAAPMGIAGSRTNRGLTVVALTNTAFEGMSGAGRFSADLSRAIYANIARPS